MSSYCSPVGVVTAFGPNFAASPPAAAVAVLLALAPPCGGGMALLLFLGTAPSLASPPAAASARPPSPTSVASAARRVRCMYDSWFLPWVHPRRLRSERRACPAHLLCHPFRPHDPPVRVVAAATVEDALAGDERDRVL